MVVDGVNCEALDDADGNIWFPPEEGLFAGERAFLRCLAPKTRVGYKTVQVFVAGQQAATVNTSSKLLKGVCLEGWYGKDTDGGADGTLGQKCARCPSGATCPGYGVMPQPIDGWYR